MDSQSERTKFEDLDLGDEYITRPSLWQPRQLRPFFGESSSLKTYRELRREYDGRSVTGDRARQKGGKKAGDDLREWAASKLTAINRSGGSENCLSEAQREQREHIFAKWAIPALMGAVDYARRKDRSLKHAKPVHSDDSEAGVEGGTSAASTDETGVQSETGRTRSVEDALTRFDIRGSDKRLKRPRPRRSSGHSSPAKLLKAPVGPRPSSDMIPSRTEVYLHDGRGQDLYVFSAVELYDGKHEDVGESFFVGSLSFARLCETIDALRDHIGKPSQASPLSIEYWDAGRQEPAGIFQDGSLWYAFTEQLAGPGRPEVVLRCMIEPQDAITWDDMDAHRDSTLAPRDVRSPSLALRQRLAAQAEHAEEPSRHASTSSPSQSSGAEDEEEPVRPTSPASTSSPESSGAEGEEEPARATSPASTSSPQSAAAEHPEEPPRRPTPLPPRPTQVQPAAAPTTQQQHSPASAKPAKQPMGGPSPPATTFELDNEGEVSLEDLARLFAQGRTLIPRDEIRYEDLYAPPVPASCLPDARFEMVPAKSHAGGATRAAAHTISDDTGGDEEEANDASLMQSSGNEEKAELWPDMQLLTGYGEPAEDQGKRLHCPGIERKYAFFPYQLLSIVWLLQVSARTKLAFLADTMGLGKTNIALGMIYMQTAVNVATRNVRDSRREQGRDEAPPHLPTDLGETPLPATCPSVGAGAVPAACPCLPEMRGKFPTHGGPTLILVPGSLGGNWANILSRSLSSLDDRHTKALEVYFHSADKLPSRLKKANPSVKLWTKEKAASFRSSGERPRLDLSNKIVLTTHKRVRSFYRGALDPDKWQKAHDGIVWGTVIVDEFHRAKSASTELYRCISRLDGHTRIVYLSGTPYEKSVADLVPAIGACYGFFDATEDTRLYDATTEAERELLSTRAIDERAKTMASAFKGLPSLRHWMRSQELIDKHKGRNAKFAAFLDACGRQRELLELVMMRRTATSRLFGQPLNPFPSLKFYNVHVGMGEGDAARLGELTKQLFQGVKMFSDESEAARAKKFFEAARLARIASAVPAVAHAYLDGFTSTVSGKRQLCNFTRSAFVDNRQARADFWEDYGEHVATSPKLVALHTLIRANAAFESEPAGHAAMRRGVVTAQNPATAWLAYSFLTEHCGLEATFLSSRTTERQEQVDAFTEQEPGAPQFLVGSSGQMKEGFTMTRAYVLYMLEAEWNNSDEAQLAGRVCRFKAAQPASSTYVYRIVSNESETEQAILKRQESRALFDEYLRTRWTTERPGRGNDSDSDDVEMLA